MGGADALCSAAVLRALRESRREDLNRRVAEQRDRFTRAARLLLKRLLGLLPHGGLGTLPLHPRDTPEPRGTRASERLPLRQPGQHAVEGNGNLSHRESSPAPLWGRSMTASSATFPAERAITWLHDERLAHCLGVGARTDAGSGKMGPADNPLNERTTRWAWTAGARILRRPRGDPSRRGEDPAQATIQHRSLAAMSGQAWRRRKRQLDRSLNLPPMPRRARSAEKPCRSGRANRLQRQLVSTMAGNEVLTADGAIDRTIRLAYIDCITASRVEVASAGR